MERTGLEVGAAVEHLARDGDTVGPVICDRGDAEDRGDGDVRAQCDQVDADTYRGHEPHGINRRLCLWMDFCPDPCERDHLVAGYGPKRACRPLHPDHSGEVEDYCGADGKEAAGLAAEDVVEDLSDGLVDWGVEEGLDVPRAVGEDYGEEPAGDVGEG